MKILQKFLLIALTFLLATCDIKDDIAYPVINGHITAFEVEGQCDDKGGASSTPIIDKQTRTITLYVSDTVDVANLRVTKVAVASTTENMGISQTELPHIQPNTNGGEKFPEHGFNDTTGILNIRMDFTRPVEFRVSTLQDYIWTVVVNQVVKREIELENQVGPAIIEPSLCNAIVYVKKGQNLRHLKVNKFSLGGEHGSVKNDPTGTYANFYRPQTFEVTTGWGATQIWNVMVDTVEVVETKDPVTMTTNAWSNFAMLEATIAPEDEAFKTTLVYGEWKRVDEEEWAEIPNYELTIDRSDSTAYQFGTTIRDLAPGTEYEFRLRYEDGGQEQTSKSVSFTTEEQTPLYNGGFEEWSQSGAPWYANEAGVSFWDSSNPGSTTLGPSYNVTTQTDYPKVSGDYAAKLESRAIVGKFAAASLYVGQFKEMVGTQGAKLDWGRSFTTRPTALKGWMQYAPNAVDKAASGVPAGAPAKGELDQCGMFVALLTESISIDNTDLSTIPDLETDARVVAYGALPQEQNVHTNGQWKRVNIPLVYNDLNRKPTHLLIVFSASKYGDYFHGGTGSTLYLDDFELVYGDRPLVK